MQITLTLLALASIHLASAQPAPISFPGEPACAVGCLSTAILAVRCSANDLACQCSPERRSLIQSALNPCIVQNCLLSDALNAAALASSVCAAFSATNPSSAISSPSAPAAQPNPLPSAPAAPVSVTASATATGFNVATMATAPILGGPTVAMSGFSPLSTDMGLSMSDIFNAPLTQSIISATLTLPTILFPSGGPGPAPSGGRGRGNGTRGGGGGRGGRNGTRTNGGGKNGGNGNGMGQLGNNGAETGAVEGSVFQSFVSSTATQGPLQQTRAGGVSRSKSLGPTEGVVMGLGSLIGLALGLMGLL